MKAKKISQLLIGTNNKGKLREIKALLPKNIKIYSTSDYNLKSPKENGKTFRGNSLIKASFFSKKSNQIVRPAGAVSPAIKPTTGLPLPLSLYH